MYPDKLNNIINLFEMLPEDERRETLVSYTADNAKQSRAMVEFRSCRCPQREVHGRVGVYLHVDEQGRRSHDAWSGANTRSMT
jgi:hypothetical protein